MSNGSQYAPFSETLPFGQEAENRVAALLFAAGAMVQCGNEGAKQDLHVIFYGEVFRLEVKCEDNYAENGTLCVEYLQGDPPRPSGISTSHSQLWVHTLGDNCAIYWAQAMRNYGKRTKPESIKAGDNHNVSWIVKIGGIAASWFDYRPLVDIGRSPVWRWNGGGLQ